MSKHLKYASFILSICLCLNLATTNAYAHDCKVKAQDQALTESIHSDVFIKNWTSLATAGIMTFGFHDYKKRLRTNSSYFTRTGWDSFVTALHRSGIIEGIETNQQLVTAAIKGVPLIRSSEVVDGHYQWVVEVPLIVSYRMASKISSQNMNVEIKILRSYEGTNDGIGIEQWIVTTD